MFNPKKYWAIEDQVAKYLIDFLTNIRFDVTTKYTDNEIIQKCITGAKEHPLSAEQKIELRNILSVNDKRMFTFFAQKVSNTITCENEIQLASLGCGNRSLFEEIIHTEISHKYPDMTIHWIALDIGDYRDSDSFFIDKPFVIIDSNPSDYYQYVSNQGVKTILVGTYSFHHLGIDFNLFLKKCSAFDAIFLLEEPTTSLLWEQNEYRIMRIAFDVLANTVFVLDWAEQFINNSELFTVNYIKEDSLDTAVQVIPFPNTIPETALVMIRKT